MIPGKVSYKYVVDKIYRDLDINEELPEESIISWIAEALLFVGAFDQFDSCVQILHVENHQVCLPKGFYKLQEITNNKHIMYWAGNSQIRNWVCENASIQGCQNCQGETFYIDNYILHTSVSEGDSIAITYLSMGVDEDGYPLIPDDVYFFEACKSFVVKMLDWQNWRKGRVTDKVKADSEERWNFYVQAARGAANMPDAQRMERIKERLIRLIPDQSAYQNLFQKNQEQKFLK